MPAEELFTKEMSADGRVAIYRFATLGSEAAEQWYKEMGKLFTNADGSQPRLLLFDVRQSHNLISAEMFKTLRVAAADSPIVPGKTAILVAPDMSTKTVEILMAHSPFESTGRQIKMFSDEQKAIDWLLES